MAWGDFNNLWVLKGGHTENGDRFFSVVSSGRTSASGHKLKHTFCSWGDRLPGDLVEYSVFNIIKSPLDMDLGSWLYVALLEQGDWIKWPPQIPSNLNYSVILGFVLVNKKIHGSSLALRQVICHRWCPYQLNSFSPAEHSAFVCAVSCSNLDLLRGQSGWYAAKAKTLPGSVLTSWAVSMIMGLCWAYGQCMFDLPIKPQHIKFSIVQPH